MLQFSLTAMNYTITTNYFPYPSGGKVHREHLEREDPFKARWEGESNASVTFKEEESDY